MGLCVPGMPCYQNTTSECDGCTNPYYVYPTECNAECTPISTDCVTYTGAALVNSGVESGDSLTEVIQRLDELISSGGVPLSRELTINGVTYDLSEDREWTVGEVVTLTEGTGIDITGSYPNFTISTSGSSFSLTNGSGTTVGGDTTSVDLGGTLTSSALIEIDAFNLDFERINGANESYLLFRDAYILLNRLDTGVDNSITVDSTSVSLVAYDLTGGYSTTIDVNPTIGITLGGDDPAFSGARYLDDYSANYTNRSLVDKEYVDNAVGGGGSFWSLASGGTFTGQNDIDLNGFDFVISNSGADADISITSRDIYLEASSGTFTILGDTSPINITATGTTLALAGNFITMAAPAMIYTSGVTTGTGATAGFQQVYNSLTTGNGLDISSSSLTTGNLVSLSSTGTAATSNLQTVLNIETSGANATSAQTTYGARVFNTHTGTSSTNVAGYFSASGGETNIALNIPSGGIIVGNFQSFFNTEKMLIREDWNGYTQLYVGNGQNGTAAMSGITVGNPNNSNIQFQMVVPNTSFTSSGMMVAGTSVLRGVALGNGMHIGNMNGTPISFWTNNVKRITVDGSTGNLLVAGATTTNLARLYVLQPTLTTTQGLPAFRVDGGAHTNLTASTEYTDIDYNLARTVQFATGAITTQRSFVIQAPTYGFVGSSTITNAASFSVTGGPFGGTNATLTNSSAIYLPTWVATNTTNAHGLHITAPSGGTNNYGLTVTANTAAGNYAIYATGTSAFNTSVHNGASISAGAGLFRIAQLGNVDIDNSSRISQSVTTNSGTDFTIGGSVSNASTTLGGFRIIKTYSASNGAPTITNVRVGTTYNFTGSVSGGSLIGYEYAPTLTSMTGITTHLAWRNTSGSLLFGGTTITAGSVLADFQSTTLGVLMPRVTNIASVATPVDGMIAYDAATNKFNFRENAAWVQLGGGSGWATTGTTTLTGNTVIDVDDYGLTFNNTSDVNFTQNSAAVPGAALAVTSGDRSAITVENTSVYFNLASTHTFTTGTKSFNRTFRLDAPTLNGSSTTITNAAAFAITGAPIQGSSMTIDNTHGLLIQSAAVSTATNSYGLTVNAMTGATNNYSAQFLGGFGIKVRQAAQSTNHTFVDMAQTAATGGRPIGYWFAGANHTGITASTEVITFLMDVNYTMQWATGALTTQRNVVVQGVTLAFVGSSTVTDAATFAINSAPKAGTNANITNAHGLLIQTAALNSVNTPTNSYGLTVNAQTGATNNYSAQFLGGSGIKIDNGTYGAAPADSILISAKDSSDGAANSTLALSLEQAVEAIGTFTASHKIKVWINNVEYWLQLDAV